MTIRTASLTELILETFKLNGSLLDGGEDLVADLGLTAARWQVLGAIDLSPHALPVSHIARNMGLTRQSVQRVVNDMTDQGFLQLTPNPHHQRAKLTAMTAKGRAAFDAAMARQLPWAEALAVGLSAEDIATTIRVMRDIRTELQSRKSEPAMENDDVVEHT